MEFIFSLEAIKTYSGISVVPFIWVVGILTYPLRGRKMGLDSSLSLINMCT